MALFHCVSCGDIDPGLVCYEPTASTCTLCGTVVQECPWETTSGITEFYENHTPIPGHLLRVFEDLEVEPVDVWWNMTIRTRFENRIRVQDMLYVLAKHHPQFHSGFYLTRLLEYAMEHRIAPEKILVHQEKESEQDIYGPLVIRLSEMFPMSHSERRTLRRQISDAVQRTPQLELRMPNAVVVAVYGKLHPENKSMPDVCRWMKISLATVRKVATLI